MLTGVAAQLEGVETGGSLGDLQLGIMWVTTKAIIMHTTQHYTEHYICCTEKAQIKLGVCLMIYITIIYIYIQVGVIPGDDLHDSKHDCTTLTQFFEGTYLVQPRH